MPDVETNILIVDTPLFVFASDQCTTRSETNGGLDFDNYPDDKVVKNHEDFLCQLYYSSELPVQNYIIAYHMSIQEEPPTFLPPPESPPLTYVSFTIITTKWGYSYQEWGECNSTHC